MRASNPQVQKFRLASPAATAKQLSRSYRARGPLELPPPVSPTKNTPNSGGRITTCSRISYFHSAVGRRLLVCILSPSRRVVAVQERSSSPGGECRVRWHPSHSALRNRYTDFLQVPFSGQHNPCWFKLEVDLPSHWGIGLELNSSLFADCLDEFL